MKIPKKKKQNKFIKTIKILVIGLSLVLSIVAPNTIVHAELTQSNDGLVTVNKTSQAMDEFNKFKIKLDINTGKVEDSVETIGNDIVLVLDTSGSMGSRGITAVKNAAKKLLQNQDLANNPKNTFSVVTFADESKILLDKGTAKQAISTLDGDRFPDSNGGTHLQAGLKNARDILANSDNGHIVLLSDGEPTYTYHLNYETNRYRYVNNNFAPATQDDHLLGYGQDYYYTEPAIDYNQTDGRGTGNVDYGSIRLIQNGRYISSLDTDSYLIAENIALFAKQQDHKIFTIGYNTNSTVTNFLKRVASQGEGYAYSTNGDLDGIFNNIANSIVTSYTTMIKGGVVSDPMSDYVDLIGLENGRYDYDDPRLVGIASLSQGSIIVSGGDKKIITWEVGDVLKESEAHLEYYVSLKEQYIDGTPYNANKTTTLNYNDYLDTPSSIDFPIPQVLEEVPIDSATLTIKKIVTDSDENKEFMIHVTGRDISDENIVIYETDLLLRNNEEIILEGLPFGKYTVSETVPMEYSLIKNEVGYSQEGLTTGNVIELTKTKDGHSGYVVLTNKFTHVGFFKATDEKTNYLPVSDEIVNNYTVNISGNVKQTISKAPQDVVLVLDKSGSMDDYMGYPRTRLDVLKSNVISFINKLYEHNPESRVSIITFAGDESDSLTNNDFVKLSDRRGSNDTWKSYLTKDNGAIDSIEASGGTPTDVGLYAARNALAKATGSNNKSVILFTDGQPGNYGFETDSYYRDNGYRVGAETLNQADFIKGSGYLTNINNYLTAGGKSYYGSRYDDVTRYRGSSYNNNDAGNRNREGQGLNTKLFAIGINGSNDSEFDNFLTKVASPGHYTKANNSAAMEDAFNSIFTSITTMDTDVAIRLQYDATKFAPSDLQGGKLGGNGVNAYIEWNDIIDEKTGTFAVKGIKFKNIVGNAGELQLTIAGYKNNVVTELVDPSIEIVGN